MYRWKNLRIVCLKFYSYLVIELMILKNVRWNIENVFFEKKFLEVEFKLFRIRILGEKEREDLDKSGGIG